MNHGYVKAKKAEGDIEKGQEGILTAYLPEMDKFAVFWEKDKWFTYNWTEKKFLEYFEKIK
jgi:hypothetical protein